MLQHTLTSTEPTRWDRKQLRWRAGGVGSLVVDGVTPRLRHGKAKWVPEKRLTISRHTKVGLLGYSWVCDPRFWTHPHLPLMGSPGLPVASKSSRRSRT